MLIRVRFERQSRVTGKFIALIDIPIDSRRKFKNKVSKLVNDCNEKQDDLTVGMIEIFPDTRPSVGFNSLNFDKKYDGVENILESIDARFLEIANFDSHCADIGKLVKEYLEQHKYPLPIS